MFERVAISLTRWATRTTRELLAQLRAAGAEGDPGEEQDDMEVVQPMGIRVRPVQRASLEGLAVDWGDRRVVLVLVDKSREAGAVEPEEGETQLHGLAQESAVVRIRASGDIEITPASGRDVILAGGSLGVARSSDAVQTTLGALAAGGLTAPPGGGPCTLTAGPITLSGTITGAGAPHVKA